MTQDDDLQLSGIQHFSFCRRQWALIHIEDQWQENGLTAEGSMQHDRVHDESISDFRGGVLTLRGMRIRSDRLRVSGVCDAVEFTPDPDGIALRGREGLWRPCPVEYKHGAGKLSDCDRLQLAAQALCLEEMLCCEIPAGALFYWKTRRRERVEIDAGLREKTERMLREMREYYDRRYTPRVKPGKACESCSLSDACLPRLLRKGEAASVAEYVRRHAEETGE